MAFARRLRLLTGLAFLLVGLILGGYALVSRLFTAWEEGSLEWQGLLSPVCLIGGVLIFTVAIYREVHHGVPFNGSRLTYLGLGVLVLGMVAMGL